MLVTIGMEAFAERPGGSCEPMRKSVRKRSVETITELTLQEELIARLARDGLSNPEIAARPFLGAQGVYSASARRGQLRSRAVSSPTFAQNGRPPVIPRFNAVSG
jgi:hypothetical protein